MDGWGGCFWLGTVQAMDGDVRLGIGRPISILGDLVVLGALGVPMY